LPDLRHQDLVQVATLMCDRDISSAPLIMFGGVPDTCLTRLGTLLLAGLADKRFVV